MTDDLATVVARVRSQAVCSIADAAVLLDRSRNRLYEDIRVRGEVAGIPVVRLSKKSVRLPSRPLLRLVGIEDDTSTTKER